jgi:parvulin-like peptidyl-prolyl isomerase
MIMTLIVSGERVEDSEIQKEIERLRPRYEQVFAEKDPDEREKQLLEWSRENVIERVLLRQHAGQNGQAPPQDQVDTAFEQLKEQAGGVEQLENQFGKSSKEVKKEIALNMKVQRMLDEVCSDLPAPTKNAIRDFYEQNKEHLRTPEQIRVAHIVKHIDGRTDAETAREMIQKAYEELKNGAVFETLAARYSDCPENGGDLGYITRGQMVEEFEDVVFNLDVNETSDIFQTRFGFHIAKVYDRKPSAIAELKDVEEQIIAALKEKMSDEAVERFVDELKSTAQIEDV